MHKRILSWNYKYQDFDVNFVICVRGLQALRTFRQGWQRTPP